MKNYLLALRRFLQTESSSGLVLILAALLAMLLANSSWSGSYHNFWQTPLVLPFSQGQLIAPPLFWINEGLMSLFFFLVGMELKREILGGELSKPSRVLLPLVAALGGMLVPGLIYYVLNAQNPETAHGWAIPVATDIAFALGALALLGRRVPLALKLFLMALAIFDDLGAILIITISYARHFAWLPLFAVLGLTLLGYSICRAKLNSFWPYLCLGFLLWMAVFKSGIHPAISGVILAFMMPNADSSSLLSRAETALHPWVAYFIMPLFALANAGVSFSAFSFLPPNADRIVLGIFAGLFLGKQLGVFAFSWIFIRLGLGRLPRNCSWLGLWGVSILCGIGFTMSLFLGTLAFTGNELYLSEVRLGVFLGSMLSGLIGGAVLFLVTRWKNK